MGSIYLYKTSNMYGGQTVRLELANLSDLNMTLDQPVSPMALPQEDASENVLVKMEGNTQTVTVNWKVADSFPKPQQCISQLLISGIEKDISEFYAGGSSSATWSDATSSDLSGRIISWLLSTFQGKDITDRYFIKLGEDVDVMEGFITRINANISGNSPVVWDVSITFIMGNVISIYESDAPSEARNVSTSTVNNSGGASSPTRMVVSWSTPSDTASVITTYGVFTKTYDTSYNSEPDFTFDIAGSGTEAELNGHVTNGANYEVSWGDPSGDDLKKEDGTSYTVADFNTIKGETVTSGRQYWFKVAAKNENGGWGLKSNEVTATMP